MNQSRLTEFQRHQQEIERQIHRVWTPHSSQLPIAMSFLQDWVTGVFVRCGRKWGKALCLDTPILTPNGFKRNGDIVPGDIVYDEMGNHQSVLFAHDVIESPDSYRVHFCNGTCIDACADHQWFTWTKADRKNQRRDLSFSPSVKSTIQIYNSQMCGKEYNHSIPYARPVEMTEKFQEIDPYLLGCWLGDGHTHKSYITSIDEPILQAFRDGGFDLHRDKSDHISYGIVNGFITKLKSIGVFKNKHIPDNYLFGSIEQRLALLQGLMDTDGCVGKTGNNCEFVSKLQHLSDSVYFLVSSLGMKPFKSVRMIRIREGDIRPYYRVKFRPIGEVFRLQRKQSRVTKDTTKRLHKTIVKVEKIQSKPMRCLTVSGPSKLYLAGYDLTPTHNTEIAIYLAYIIARLFDNSEVYYIADEEEHGGDICWDNGRLPYFFTTQKQNLLMHESDEDFRQRKLAGIALHREWVSAVKHSEKRVVLTNGSFIKVEGAKNFTIADGLSPTFVIYDEFKDHDKRFDTRMRPNLYALKGRILVIGTPPPPEDPSGDHYRATELEFKTRKNHRHFNMPCYMNEHVYPGGKDNQDLIEEEKVARAKGEYHVFAREFLALDFPDTQRAIFPMFDEREHVKPHALLLQMINYKRKDWSFYTSYDPASTSTFGVIHIAINNVNKVVFCMDEIYEQQQMNTRSKDIYKRAEKQRLDIYPVDEEWNQTYDHAEAWFQTEIALEFGIGISPCTKDTNNKESKLSVIKECMLFGRWYFSDRCVNAIREFKSYAKDDKGNIPKKNDHLIDPARYIMNAAAYSSCPRIKLDFDSLVDRRYFTPEYDSSHDRDSDMEALLGSDDNDYDY